MARGDGVVNQMCCKVCTTIEGKERILAAKLDSLYKHARRKKTKANHLGMAKGTIYYYKNFVHQKNETLYVASIYSNVVHQLDLGEIGEKKNKKVQFAIVFYLLREGRPLTNYESFKDLFYFFKIKNMPMKHWFDNLGWKMEENIHYVVLEHTKEVIKGSPFLAFFVDEITTSDTESWNFIHGKFVIDTCFIELGKGQ